MSGKSYSEEIALPTYCRLGHPVFIRNAWVPFIRNRIFELLREYDTVLKIDVMLCEAPEVHNDTRIGFGPLLSIRKCISVNLDMILVGLVIPHHELGIWIIKWDRERVGGILLLVVFNFIFVVGIVGDIINDAVF